MLLYYVKQSHGARLRCLLFTSDPLRGSSMANNECQRASQLTLQRTAANSREPEPEPEPESEPGPKTRAKSQSQKPKARGRSQKPEAKSQSQKPEPAPKAKSRAGATARKHSQKPSESRQARTVKGWDGRGWMTRAGEGLSITLFQPYRYRHHFTPPAPTSSKALSAGELDGAARYVQYISITSTFIG